MQSELEQGKRERDRLLLFEKEVIKKREDSKRDGSELTKEGLEKDIAKVSHHSCFSLHSSSRVILMRRGFESFDSSRRRNLML